LAYRLQCKGLEELDGKWVLFAAADVHAGIPGCISAMVRTTEINKEKNRADEHDPKNRE
jgi:hypothetical protein